MRKTKDIGDIIHEYRFMNDVTMQEFAARCGLTKGYISQLENKRNPSTGKPPVPTLDAINAIARAMHRSLDDVLNEMGGSQRISLAPALPENLSPVKQAYIDQVISLSDDEVDTLHKLLDLWRSTRK